MSGLIAQEIADKYWSDRPTNDFVDSCQDLGVKDSTTLTANCKDDNGNLVPQVANIGSCNPLLSSRTNII
jgi:hypothetical protein